MEFQELRVKDKNELQKILWENTEKLRILRFKVAQKQIKNMRELRMLKRENAKIKTALQIYDSKKENYKKV